MFDKPYKKQKKVTPLSEEALKRFDKEIPQRRGDWYTPRSHTDEDADIADDEEETENAEASHAADFETNADVEEAPTETVDEEKPSKKNLRMHPSEVPKRLQFSQDADPEIAPRPSSERMSRLRAEALAEAKAKHRSVEERRQSTDFRSAHRDAVKAKRSQSQSKWEDETGTAPRKKSTIGLLELLGVLAVVVIGIVLVSKFTNREKSEVSQTALEEEVPFASVPQQSMEEVLQGFYQCKTVDQMLAYVRAPESVEPLMRKWYASHPIIPTRIEILRSTEGMVSDGVINAPDQLWVTANTVRLIDHQESASVMAERTQNAYKIDWESAIAISEEALGTFLENQPATAGEFRIRISPSDYYNYHFEDKEKWDCYRISSENDLFSCFGYIARGSAMARKLNSWWYPGEVAIPIIAKLKFPTDPQEKNAVEIEEVLQKNWIKRYD